MIDLLRHTPVLDKFAVSASTFCVIHCLSLPLILSLFPTLGATIFGQESFHVLLLFFVIPLSLVALTIGCKQHKSWFVASMGLIGLSVLIFTGFYGHDVLGHEGERNATLVGAFIIAVGHLWNYALCRQARCEH